MLPWVSSFPEGAKKNFLKRQKTPEVFLSQLTDFTDYSSLVIQFVKAHLKKRKMFYRTLRLPVGFKHVSSFYPVKKIHLIKGHFVIAS